MKMICNLFSFFAFFAICNSESFGLEDRAQSSLASIKNFDFAGEREKFLNRFSEIELKEFNFKRNPERSDEDLTWDANREALAATEHKRRVEERIRQLDGIEDVEEIEKKEELLAKQQKHKKANIKKKHRPTIQAEKNINEDMTEAELEKLRKYNEKMRRHNERIRKENERIAKQEAIRNAQEAERVKIEDAIKVAYKVKDKDMRKKLYRELRQRIEDLVQKNGEDPSDLRWSQSAYQKLRPLKQ